MLRKKIAINFSARLPVTIKKRDKWFVSCCPILDIHSQGNTENEAKDNLVEALSLFFLSCYERGTLDQVMKESGFDIGKFEKQPAPLKQTDLNFVDVPIPLIWNQTKKLECHV